MLYSQGYRIDWVNKRFTQTGAFYFKVLPKSAEVYLDGKLKKKTDFFSSAFVENLLPRKYAVEIRKENYSTWKKYLEIKEKQVTELKNIVLIPQNLQFDILAEQAKDFFVAPDGKKIILIKAGGGNFTLKLFDAESRVETVLLEEKELQKYFATSKIKNSKIELLDLDWSADSKKIIFFASGAGTSKYFILEIDKTPANLISLDSLGKEIEEINFHPLDAQKIFFTQSVLLEKKVGKQNGLFVVDYKKKETPLSVLNNFLAYSLSRGNIFWLSTDGFLYKSDLAGKNQEKLNSDPLLPKKEKKIEFFTRENKILIKMGNVLYFFDSNSQNFKKIFESIKSVEFPGDLKKIVFYNDSEVWILFLEKMEEQPSKEYLEQLLIARFTEKINKVSWLTSHYLIFNAGSKIKIGEIDERDQINIVDLKEIPDTQNLKIFYNQRDEKVYLLSNDNLSVSDKLIK